MAALQAEVDCQRLPGAVALVQRRGKLALFQSVGSLDPAIGTPMPSDAIFRIYSMTKPIVSVAVMMLMEQGKLLLSEPVSKFLPEFAKQQVASVVDGAVVTRPVRQACHDSRPAAPHRWFDL